MTISDGVLTRALWLMHATGLTLADSIDPAREEDFLRAPGISQKLLGRLREYARADAAQGQRGGARLGAGRKAIDGATQVVQVCIPSRPDQRAQLAKLGGSPWVRGAIDAAVRDKSHSAFAE